MSTEGKGTGACVGWLARFSAAQQLQFFSQDELHESGPVPPLPRTLI